MTETPIPPEVGRSAVALARETVENRLGRDASYDHDLEDAGDHGVFVTLELDGLRGCMGVPVPEKPLEDAVRTAAFRAAFRDPRFPPLREREIDDVTFEVTVLTPPRPVEPGEVEVGKHGLLLEKDGSTGLLLPQVPEKQGWNRDRYLQGICEKAGISPLSLDSAELKAFEGTVFYETEPRGDVAEG